MSADGGAEVTRIGESEFAYEWPRKALHLGALSLAFLLPWLTRYEAAAMAALAVLANLLWRRWDSSDRFFRSGESFAGGIVLYPLAILAAVMLLPYPAGVLAVWPVLAVGDVLASVVGRACRGRALPGGLGKTYAGSAAFLAFGGPAAFGFLSYGGLESRLALALAVATTLGGAIGEAIPFRSWFGGERRTSELDHDNLRIGILAGLAFWSVWVVYPK